MPMAAMNMVSAGRFSGVSFHLRRCPQGVASVLGKKTTIFMSRRSKLDHLTVISRAATSKFGLLNEHQFFIYFGFKTRQTTSKFTATVHFLLSKSSLSTDQQKQ
jgi:hypothetical protein